jgi:hypothetical protein
VGWLAPRPGQEARAVQDLPERTIQRVPGVPEVGDLIFSRC